jgi:mannose-6-phosphate isomerase-like protein (cupin superfamily)
MISANARIDFLQVICNNTWKRCACMAFSLFRWECRMNDKERTYFIDYHAFIGTEEGKVFKTTLARSGNMLVSLEGSGYFQVGDVFQTAAAGTLVWTPAALPHGVVNNGAEPLVLLVVISPSPAV